MTTTVTSPVAIIPLNGVPSGHYYKVCAVAAVNSITVDQRMFTDLTGSVATSLCVLVKLAMIHTIVSRTFCSKP